MLEVSTWSLGLSHVKVVLHSFVACFFPLIILVVKSILRFRIVLHALIAQGLDLVVVVLGAGNL